MARDEEIVSTEVLYLEKGETHVLANKVPFDFSKTGSIGWISVNFNKRNVGYEPRVIFGTKDNSFHAISTTKKLWTMEESITKSASTLFIDLPSFGSPSQIIDELGQNASTHLQDSIFNRFLTRVTKHIQDIKVQVFSDLRISVHLQTQVFPSLKKTNTIIEN